MKEFKTITEEQLIHAARLGIEIWLDHENKLIERYGNDGTTSKRAEKLLRQLEEVQNYLFELWDKTPIDEKLNLD